MILEERLLSVREAADFLAVSSATVRNWIRHEYLRPEKNRKGLLFRYSEVSALHDGIRSGTVRRLDRRANKATSRKIFIPEEYTVDDESLGAITGIVDLVRAEGLEAEKTLFVLAVRMLAEKGMLGDADPMKVLRGDVLIPGRKHLLAEIRDWHGALDCFDVKSRYAVLSGCRMPEQRDALGLLYQSMTAEGDKAAGGSYYTPGHLVEDVVSSHVSGNMRVFDPCCGTGQFLLGFARRMPDPGNLHGVDVDRIAVRIARINLMMMLHDIDFTPNIFHRDFLTDDICVGTTYDLIATNPPWGQHYSAEEVSRLSSLYPEISSRESFSYFLRKGLDLLREDGLLSFILPESILNVRIHGDIRNYIADHARIERIIPFGRIFTRVFSRVIRLDLVKKGSRGTSRAACTRGGGTKDRDFMFNINVKSADRKVIDRVYEYPHTSLRGRADWVLGIVTGENRKFLSAERIDGTWEPVYRGRDVDRYFFRAPSCYIRYTPGEYQQSAPVEKYRAREKLVYRFISKRLIFAYDDRGRLTLNSANAVIPRVHDFPMQVIMALFNSPLYQFIFQKKFFSIKVLRSHLEDLPIPLWSADEIRRIYSMTGGVLARRESSGRTDALVMELFGIPESERALIMNSVS